MRLPISKKMRFEIFKRDMFRCQYCGKCPPAVILEVDHIDPVANGGTTDMNNLITACFDCNRGKGKNDLGVIPNSLSENIKAISEKQEQYAEYRKHIESLKNIREKEIVEIEDIYRKKFTNYRFNENFKDVQVRRFLEELPFHEVEDAILIAIRKDLDEENTIKYFCGVCWRKVERL